MVTMATESAHGLKMKKKNKKKKTKKKTRSPRFSVTFNQIFVKLAGNEDRHGFGVFGLGRTFSYGVIRPGAFPWTLNGENGVSIFSQLL